MTSPTTNNQPKPQYRLNLQCSNCISTGKTCLIAPDLRVSGNTLAWQDSSFKGLGQYEQPKEWTLVLDLCGWSRTRDTAIDIVKAHTSCPKNGKGKGKGKAFRVDDLLKELEECGVRFESSLSRVRLEGEEEYKPRRERLVEMEHARPQFRQAWTRL